LPATFEHLVLTRFNTRLDGAEGLSSDWLEHRFRLFEEFCLPSVLGQSVRNFQWLLFCDPDTPREFRLRLESVLSDSRFHLCFVRRFEEILEAARKFVPAGCSHLITTTLDNDDALAKTYIERVQSEFREQEFEILNFLVGYRLNLLTSKLYRSRRQTNPFVSLVELNTPAVKTIRGCGPHSLLGTRMPLIRDIEANALWLQVIHERNLVGTGVWGWRRVPVSSLFGQFTLRWARPDARENPWGLRAENVRRAAEHMMMKLLGRKRRIALRSWLLWRKRPKPTPYVKRKSWHD
jgi:hypothetical protein